MTVPAAQPIFHGSAAYLEKVMAELLADTPFSKSTWHGLSRGGAAAAYHRSPVVAYFIWWSRWKRFATALEHALGYSDLSMVGPLYLPCPGAAPFAGGDNVWDVVDIWGDGMHHGGPWICLRLAKNAVAGGVASVNVSVEELAVLKHGLDEGAK